MIDKMLAQPFDEDIGITTIVDFEKKIITIEPISFHQWGAISKKRLKIEPPKEWDQRDASMSFARNIDEMLARRGVVL